jgi:hypothetical protein
LANRRPQDESLRVAESLNGSIDLGFEGAVLGFEIEQGDLHGWDSLKTLVTST